MPGEGLTHGPPAAKKQAAVTTGSAGSSGIPCTAVLTLIRVLPGDRLSCPRVATTRYARCAGRQHRGARTTRLHVRDTCARLIASNRVHHIPPHVRDDAYAPPTKQDETSIAHFRKNETRFMPGELNRKIGLETQHKPAFRRVRDPKHKRRRSHETISVDRRRPLTFTANDAWEWRSPLPSSTYAAFISGAWRSSRFPTAILPCC